MRVVQNAQMKIGEVDISKIQFDPRSRDDIPKTLRGLQCLYMDLPFRKSLFKLLIDEIAPSVSKNDGRPGMPLWNVFVCGVLRLNLNCDYDRIHELSNKHQTVREMLGHGCFDSTNYHYQTLADNVSLITPEILGSINQLAVTAGHALVKKNGEESLHARCDSFVVETNVHYPTDISLLLDAMRKVMTLMARMCEDENNSAWRQHAYSLRSLKRLMRTAQNKKRGKSKIEAQQEENAKGVMAAHQAYLDAARGYLSKARETLATLESRGFVNNTSRQAKLEIEGFMAHATRQIDQTHRRVILGETIAHAEKVFSIFEPHTEWICKGKAGVPVELGLKVCILEDHHQFILHHAVMEKTTDDQIAVAMVSEAKQRFPGIVSCSFDKGFHSQSNQQELKAHLTDVVLPRKGKLSEQARAHEQSETFKSARRRHSAVESAINALGVHGLDRCPDHGIDGFKRYVAFAVVARNIHRIGALVWQRDQASALRKQKYAVRDIEKKRAA